MSMPKKMHRSIGWRGVTAFVLALVAAAASAQPKPALVQNRDEPGRTPYQKQVNIFSGDCPSPDICYVNFGSAPVPAGQRLVVTQVAVKLNLSSASVDAAAVEITDFTLAASLWYRVPGEGNFRFFAAPLTYYIEAGSYPFVSIYGPSGPSVTGGSVAIIGYLVTL